jgi:tellurite methyltransferase
MEPAPWLVDHRHLLPPVGRALDVAAGRGRHALWLAQRGYETTAIDRDAGALQELREAAARLGVHVTTEVRDLEIDGTQLPVAAYDVVVVVHYLHRPLFAAVKDAVRPGGVLIYETFTAAQAARGKPTNPAFLLQPGELQALVAPFEVVARREGDFDGKMLASVIARRP